MKGIWQFLEKKERHRLQTVISMRHLLVLECLPQNARCKREQQDSGLLSGVRLSCMCPEVFGVRYIQDAGLIGHWAWFSGAVLALLAVYCHIMYYHRSNTFGHYDIDKNIVCSPPPQGSQSCHLPWTLREHLLWGKQQLPIWIGTMSI